MHMSKRSSKMIGDVLEISKLPIDSNLVGKQLSKKETSSRINGIS